MILKKFLKAAKDEGYTPGSLFEFWSGNQGTRAFITKRLCRFCNKTKAANQIRTTDDPKFVRKVLKKLLAGLKTVC